MNEFTTQRVERAGSLATNRVLRNTYWLLSLTLAFSAVCAYAAMKMNVPYLGPWITLGGYFALLFLTNALRNSAWGLLSIFALTGFMGMTMGTIVSMVTGAFSNGNELVMLAFGGTATIFVVMSGIALTSKRDFSFMGSFLMVGILVAFLAGIGALVFKLPTLSLVVSAMFMLLSSGLILYQTNQIARGGETNYISATITLYVSIYNLFSSLLHLLMSFMGED